MERVMGVVGKVGGWEWKREGCLRAEWRGRAWR